MFGMTKLLLFSIIALCALFLLGVAMRVWRSPNQNPLAQLATLGINTEATVVDLEPDGDEPNVVLRYEAEGQVLTRSLPWPPNKALPEIGAPIEVRYLPGNPGLSRLVS
jgi:hypothetical protein